MLERNLEAKLVKAVKELGGLAYKIDSAARKGAPDRIIALPGKTPFFLELKTETGRVSPLQAVEHDRLRKIGQRVVVAYGWQQIEEALRA